MVMGIINTSANFIFPLITYSYVARILKTSGTGRVAFVQSVLTYFSYIAALGISSYGMRECARVRDNKDELSKLTQELLFINLISTLIAYVALFISVAAVPKFESYRALFAVMSCSILLQTLGMEWLYSALEQYTYITVRSLIFKSISVVLTFILVKDSGDYVIYGGLTIFTTAASNVLNFINARKFICVRKYKHYELKKHLKPIMVFFMSAIIISVYAQFDTVMLGFMKGDSEVGIYNAAVKIKTIVVSVSSGLTSVLIPRMSLYYTQDKQKYNSLLSKSFRVALVLLIPLVTFIFINAEDVLLFLCGTEFLGAKPTLRILMVCIFALMLTNLFGNQILVPKGAENRYAKSVFAGMWTNLILNCFLIPRYCSAGAAFATLITEVSNTIWMSQGCKEEIKALKQNVRVLRYVFPVCLAIVLEWISRSMLTGFPVFWRLSGNAVVLFSCYYLILFIQKEEIVYSGYCWLRGKLLRRSKRTAD